MAGAVELATAYITILPETAKLSSSIRKEFDGVSRESDKAGKKSGGLFSGALGGAMAKGAKVAGGAVVATLGTMLWKGFGRLKAIEQAEAKLRGLGHSAEVVDKVMKNALASVKGTAFGLGDAATAAANAIAAGIKPGQELERYLKGIGDAATIAGVDFNSMGAIFGKVAAKNKIQGMEINQLSQQGVPILQLLAKQMGVTAEEAGKLASKGKISFADFQQAMESGMKGAALEGGKTVSGAFDNLIASLGRVGANILKPLYKLLPGFLTWVTGLLGPVEEFATKAGEFIVDAFSGIGSLLFKGDFTAEFNKAFDIEEDSPVVAWILGTREKIGEAFDGIGALLTKGDFTGVLSKAFSIEEDSGVVDWLLKMRDSFLSVGDVIVKIAGVVMNYLRTSFVESGRVLNDVLLPAFMSFLDSPFMQWVREVVSAFVEKLLPVFKTIGDVIASDVLPAFTSLSRFLSALTVGIVKFVAAFLNSPITGWILGVLKPVIIGFFNTVSSVLVNALKVIGGVFEIIGGLLSGDWVRMWEGAKQVFGAFFAAIKDVLGTVLDLFGAFFSTIGEWFGSWLGPLFDGFKNVVTTAFTAIADAVKIVAAAIQVGMGVVVEVLKQAGGMIATVFTALIPVFRTVGEVIATVVTVIVGAVVGISKVVGGIVAFLVELMLRLLNVVVAPLVAAFKVVIPAALNFMRTVFVNTWNDIVGIVSAVWGVLQPILTAIRDWLADKIGTALRVMGGFFATVWGGIVGVVTAAWNQLLAIFTPIYDWLAVRIVAALNILRTWFATTWTAIQMVVSTAWNGLVANVFTPINTWFTVTLPAALAVLRTWFTTAWTAIQVAVTVAWNTILTNVLTPIRNWFTVTLPAALGVLRTWFATVWAAILTAIQAAWAGVLVVLTLMRNWFTIIITVALTLLRNAVTAAWNGIQAAISTVWNFLLDSVFTPLRNWLEKTFPGAFKLFADVGRAMWTAFGKAVSDTKDFVIRSFDSLRGGLTALQGFFRSAVDAIGGLWDGLREKVRAPVVFVVNTIIRDGLVRAWNAVATKVGLGAFNFAGMAGGGSVHGHSPTDKADNIPAWLTAGEFVTKRRSVRQMRKKHPGALEYINQHGSLPGFASGGMVYPSMIAWIRKNAPGVQITSSYRPGGGTSYHASGRALDLAPSMALFNKILATFGASIAELIYTPAGGRQIKDGRAVPASFWGARVASMHYNHVHWAMRSPVGNVPVGAGADLGDAAGGSFNVANPVALALKALLSPIFGLTRSAIGGIAGMFGNSEWVQMMAAFAKSPVDAFEKFLQDKIDAIFPELSFGGGDDGVDEVGMTTTPGAELKSTAAVRGMVQQMANAQGWGRGPNWEALKFIIQRESAWNPAAKNPTSTAYGLFQFLNTTWASVGARKTSDPTGQTQAGLAYIKQRYGTPTAARAFWQRNNWYGEGGEVLDPFGGAAIRPDYTELMDRGGILRPGVTLVHNQTGKPETVRTWEQEQSLRPGTNITINGIKYDAVGEFASELNYALARASARSRY